MNHNIYMCLIVERAKVAWKHRTLRETNIGKQHNICMHHNITGRYIKYNNLTTPKSLKVALSFLINTFYKQYS